MLENFITTHKKLTVVIVLLALAGIVVYYVLSSGGSSQTTTTKTGYVGDDDRAGAQLILPYKNPLYSIVKNPTKIAGVPDDHNLFISAPEGYRTAAAQRLYKVGQDPTNYKITFDYESPFTPYE